MADLAHRLWAKVNDVVTSRGCWIFEGSLNGDGYGQIRGEDGRLQMVHRIVWEQLRGPIPDGLEIDHECHVRNCVNVYHLRVCTHLENSRNRDRTKTFSQYAGVTWSRKQKKWRAQIWVGSIRKRVNVYLGSFVKEIHASIAYQQALKILESCAQ